MNSLPHRSAADIGVQLERCLWWFKMGAHISEKLYGPARRREFWQDNKALCAALLQFRQRCKGRGWEIPEEVQLQMVNKLIARCQDAINKRAIETRSVAAYLGKSLSRFVEEIADRANSAYKMAPNAARLPPEALAVLVQAAVNRSITEGLERL